MLTNWVRCTAIIQQKSFIKKKLFLEMKGAICMSRVYKNYMQALSRSEAEKYFLNRKKRCSDCFDARPPIAFFSIFFSIFNTDQKYFHTFLTFSLRLTRHHSLFFQKYNSQRFFEPYLGKRSFYVNFCK